MATKKTTTKVNATTTSPAKKAVRTKKQAVKKTAASKKAKAQPTPARRPKPRTMTPDERTQRIAVAAYLRAESRGFAGGDQVSDWLLAEQEVDDRSDLGSRA